MVADLGNEVEGEVRKKAARRWNMLDQQIKKKHKSVYMKKNAKYEKESIQFLEKEQEVSTEEIALDDTY